jgi:hypothetical protein
VELTQMGALDTAILLQGKDLAQTDYKLTISASTSTVCRLVIGQSSDFSVAVSFTMNPSLDASNSTIKFGYPLHPVVFLSSQFQSTAKITLVDESYKQVASMRDDGCTYDYYFLEPYGCPVNGGAFSLQVVLSLMIQ